MTVQNIYRAVRWCYDEEALNGADFPSASAGDNVLMNHIIKAKLGDALRWICLYAPAEQLSGGSDGQTGGINIIVDETNQNVPSDGKISLGTSFVRLIRVRCSNWHRAIMGDSLLKEDSAEYIQLMDSYGAEATNDRPQAALIETAEKKVEVWPHVAGAKYDLTKLVMPSAQDLDDATDTTDVGIPPLLRTSFLYYLAFLVLSAYEDSRAPRMLEIAKMNLGVTEDKQRQ
jgi:hypothetical protein